MSHVFATGPVHLDEDGDDLRREIGKALGRMLGTPIEVRAEPSYARLRERLLGREVALAWMPPALFVHAHDAGAVASALATARSAGGRYQGALFVREDSAVREVEDLRGEAVAWVDLESCGGYLFPRMALRERGLDPDRDLRSGGLLESHARVVHAVASGVCAAGATFVELEDPSSPTSPLALAGWAPFVDPRSMRAVLVSASIPSDTVCVGTAVEASSRAAWVEALVRFHEEPGGALLLRSLLSADRLVPANPADYAPVRKAIEAER